MKVLGVFFFLFALYLIGFNIYDYLYLPDRWDTAYELVELFKYKEDAVIYIYLSFVLLLIGVGTFLRYPMGWIAVYFFLVRYLVLSFCFLFVLNDSWIQILFGLFFGGMLIVLICCMYIKQVREYYHLKPNKMIVYYSFVIILLTLYLILNYAEGHL